MENRIAGVASLALLLAGVGIAIYQSFTVSTLLGIIFTGSFIISILCIFYGYCRKCPHSADRTCRHAIPGIIASKLFGRKESSRYTAAELLITMLPVVLTVLVAQIWLLRNIPLLIAFWASVAAAVAVIRVSVCKGCGNDRCRLCPNAKDCAGQ
jgi:hypothetical protein